MSTPEAADYLGPEAQARVEIDKKLRAVSVAKVRGWCVGGGLVLAPVEASRLTR